MKPTNRTEESRFERGRGARRRNAELRDGYLALFEKSGLSAVAFCREHGLCKQTFYNWRQRVRREGAAPARRGRGFAQVAVTDGPASSGALCVQLPGGLSIDVAAHTDPLWLAQVLREL